MEYIAQEGNFRQELTEHLSAAAAKWAEQELDRLLREQVLSSHPSIIEMSRVVLTLGAQGEAVLVGRGAGNILPRETTLHVRIVAPLEDRIAYMSQWLRLTHEEAAERVRVRDGRRNEFFETHFHRPPGDPYQYDMLLNSSLLGEDLCADLIIEAGRAKLERAKPTAAGS